MFSIALPPASDDVWVYVAGLGASIQQQRRFDANGDLWISTLSQGVAIAHTGSTEIIFVTRFE